MKNKVFVTGLVLSVIAAAFVHAQQFNPESDFLVSRNDSGNSVTITEYIGTTQTVNIPPRIRNLPVTVIGDEAFIGKNVTRVTIPAGVTRIGDGAFLDCTALTSVTIPAGVTHIGDRVFEWCDELTRVTLPASLTS